MVYKRKSTLIYHLVSWLVLYLLYTHFLQAFLTLKTALVHTTLYLAFIASVFYFHFYILIPRLFKRKRVVFYVLSILVLLLIAVVANKYYASYFEISVNRLKFHHGSEGTIYFIYSGTIFTLIISGILRSIQKFRTQERQKEELRSQKTAAELSTLKAQVNPHFLFNTLNNIYSLSLEKADPAVSEMILSLSEITRYMIYETEPEFVLLEKELFYLRSYIDLEKLRCENTNNISVSLTRETDQVSIAPLLLIPFIENSFKHSRIADDPEAYINITLTASNGKISFHCENSLPSFPFKKDKTGGIGLDNVKKRLALVYPDRHTLVVNETMRKYTVHLEIQTC